MRIKVRSVSMSEVYVNVVDKRARTAKVSYSAQLDRDVGRALFILEYLMPIVQKQFTSKELFQIKDAYNDIVKQDYKMRITSAARLRSLRDFRFQITSYLRNYEFNVLADKVNEMDIIHFWCLIDIIEQRLGVINQPFASKTEA